MRTRTTVEQLAVSKGRRQSQAHGALVEEPTSRFARGRARGNLYILVEVVGPAQGRDLVADRLAELLRDIYYDQRGSITAALREAIRHANNMLADENRHSMPDQQWTVGLSCAVLRNQDLFIAQAGPSALYFAHEGQVVRFPDISPWLDGIPPEDANAAPLGKRRDVHVDLFHTQVAENDTFLLVDSHLAGHLSPQAWPRILSRPSLSELLLELSGEAEGNELSALAVRLSDDEPGQAAVEVEEPGAAIAPTLTATAVASAEPSGPPQPTPQEAQAQTATKPGAPPRDPAPGPPPRSTQEQVLGWGEQLRLGDRTRSIGLALAALWAALLAFLKSMTPSQTKSPTAPAEPAPTAKSAAPEARRPRRAAKARHPRSVFVQRLLIGLAIAIPLIVACLVLWTIIQRGEAQQAEVDDLWLSANSKWMQAQGLGEPAAVRARLADASQDLDRLLTEQPDHPGALDLQRRVNARLEESSQVRHVLWEGKLMDYESGAKLNRVVVQGRNVFVMDRHTNQVHHHQLDEFQQALQPDANTILVKKGDRIGDVLVADLLDMTWMPAGSGRQKAGLLVLDSGGNLFEYDPTSRELAALRVGATDAWQFPQLVGSHSGRFYLLDSTANQIWRYMPTKDGYASRPDEWLQTAVDLVGVRDMAVGDDIFLLYADGAIQKLAGGQPAPFDISDWDVPPRGATAIFTRPPNDTQWVYVADPGNHRIVQTGKDGSFKQQYKLAASSGDAASDALASVTSLFVDEIGGQAFFVSGDSLHMIVLPSD